MYTVYVVPSSIFLFFFVMFFLMVLSPFFVNIVTGIFLMPLSSDVVLFFLSNAVFLHATIFGFLWVLLLFKVVFVFEDVMPYALWSCLHDATMVFLYLMPATLLDLPCLIMLDVFFATLFLLILSSCFYAA